MLQWLEKGCSDIFKRHHAGESGGTITGIAAAAR